MIQRTAYGPSRRCSAAVPKRPELDLSHTLPGRGRFRVNMYKQKDAIRWCSV